MIKPLTYAQEEIIASKINLFGANGCWIWDGHTSKGYGIINFNDHPTQLAHRRLYEAWEGEITEETLDHLCRSRSCVNPAHLEPVSRSENSRRAHKHRPLKTKCRSGHDLTDESNLYWWRGHRYCEPCRQVNRDKYRGK